MMQVTSIGRWLVFFVLGVAGLAGCSVAEPGQWTQWTPSVNDLSFRIRSLAYGPDKEHNLPLEISIRNTGQAPIAISHPGRINSGEFVQTYRPFTLIGPFRKYQTPMPTLQDKMTEENVVILKGGEVFTTKAGTMIYEFSPGVQAVWLAIPCQLWPPDLRAEHIGMSKEYFAKVRPLLWSQPIPSHPVAIGPIKVIVARPEDVRAAASREHDAKSRILERQVVVDNLSDIVSKTVNEQGDVDVHGLFAAIMAVKAHAAGLDDSCREKVIADLGKLLNYKATGKTKYDYSGGRFTGADPRWIWENQIFDLFATLNDARAIGPLTRYFNATRAHETSWDASGRSARVATLIQKLGGTVSTQPAGPAAQ